MDREWALLGIPFFISIVFIIVAPSFSISEYSFFDQKKIIQSSVLLISSIFFGILIYRYQLEGFQRRTKGILGIILLLLICSSLLATLPSWAFLQVGWYLLLGQLLLLNAYLYIENKDTFIKAVLLGFILLCIIYLVRVYADYITGLLNENWTIWPQQNRVELRRNGVLLNPNAYLGFSHVRFFNHIQTWTLPLLAFAYLYFKNRMIPGLRYLLLFFISSWWMLVFAAGARGTMLALSLSLIFVLVLFKSKALKFTKIFTGTALTGLLLYLLLFYWSTTESGRTITRLSDSGRIDVWFFTLEQIMANPLLGLGPMHFSYMGIDPPWSTPHNLILQSAAEWGIPAVLLSIVLVVIGMYKFISQSISGTTQKGRKEFDLMRMALIASITAALIHSMVSGIFNSSLSQLIFTIVGGWIIGEYFLCSNQKLFKIRARKSVPQLIIILVLSINSLFVGYSVISEIPRLDERKKEFFERFDTPYTLYPRFWHQGMIYEDSVDVKK